MVCKVICVVMLKECFPILHQSKASEVSCLHHFKARKETEELKKRGASSSVKEKYREAVEEGNKVITSKPVTIEKAPPEEDLFRHNYEDEDLKTQVRNIRLLNLMYSMHAKYLLWCEKHSETFFLCGDILLQCYFLRTKLVQL